MHYLNKVPVDGQCRTFYRRVLSNIALNPSESGYESRLLPAACDGNLMQKLVIKLSRRGRTSVFLFALAMAIGPALAQAPRAAQTPSRPGQPAAPPPGPAEPASIDAGKNGEQLFKANCSACHKSAAGLSRAGGILGVQSFLRTHYTASRESAAVIAAYLNEMDAAARPGDRPARRNARPEGRPAKKDEAKPTEAKPTEAKPEQAKPEESPRPPASVPAAESKPAEPQPAPPAAPAEQKPADAPKAE
jgi:mono/diheme cytochrome c family protein